MFLLGCIVEYVWVLSDWTSQHMDRAATEYDDIFYFMYDGEKKKKTNCHETYLYHL
jgi:hypothetical protein